MAIIVLSGFSADRMGGPALERGADGYMEKGTPMQELRDATRLAVESAAGTREARAKSGPYGGKPFERVEQFRRAEDAARVADRGAWSLCDPGF